jgi:hypothetical protein
VNVSELNEDDFTVDRLIKKLGCTLSKAYEIVAERNQEKRILELENKVIRLENHLLWILQKLGNAREIYND